MDQFKQASENNLISVLEVLSTELKQRYNVDVSTSELINMLNKDSSSSSGKSSVVKRNISVNSRPSPSIARTSTTTTSTKTVVDDGNKCIAIVEKTKERCTHPISSKTPECQAQKLCGMHFKVWNNDSSKLKTVYDNSPSPATTNGKSGGKIVVSIPRGRTVATVATGPKSTKIMVNDETDVDFKATEMEDYPGYFITEQDLIYTKLSNGDRGLVGKVIQDDYVPIPPKEASIYRSSGWVILDLDNPDDIFGGYKVNNGNKINVTPSARANGVASTTATKLAVKSGVSRVIKPAAPTKVVQEDPEEEEEVEPEPPKPVARAVPKTGVKVAVGIARPSAVKVAVPVAAPKKIMVAVPKGTVARIAAKPTPPPPVVEEPVVEEEATEEQVEEEQQNGDAEGTEQAEEEQVEEEQQNGDAEGTEQAEEEQVEESEQVDE